LRVRRQLTGQHARGAKKSYDYVPLHRRPKADEILPACQFYQLRSLV